MDEHKEEPTIHEIGTRLCSLENWQHRQNGSIQRIEAKEDVTHYDIPLADAQTVLLEMSTAFAQAHAKKQALRAEIAQATTEAELNVVKWGD